MLVNLLPFLVEIVDHDGLRLVRLKVQLRDYGLHLLFDGPRG